ncbi:GDP-mannose 4,6-dehydratase [Acidobacteria bacterium AH-259-G07]|nr:GDP-mannose 4,6-dehydratase [Acidobacteria bacterium AH-259-G07]
MLEQKRKRAFLTGISGQDGSYLAEFLLSKDYEVHGLIRKHSIFGTERIAHLYQDPHEPDVRLSLHYGDLNDGSNLTALLKEIQPDEVYHLGAQSHVKVSFLNPIYTVETDGLGTLRLLEAVRGLGNQPRYYQASSSEMYGLAAEVPQRESTSFHPCSPYACAKVFAFWQTVNYREAYALHASNGIMFNHESPRRGETFVTRKISRAATRIKLGLQERLYLGNLEPQRDWGFAGDYVEAMWLMLQQDEPDDYVIATGESHCVREFCELAFGLLDLDYKDFVVVDPRYFRPLEIDVLQGDASRARIKFGWTPKVSFKELVTMMIESDLELAKREKLLLEAGYASTVNSGY